MKTVHKYPFNPGSTTLSLELPKGAKPLHFAFQNNKVIARFCLWILVDPQEKQTDLRRFTIVGTGHDVPLHTTYIGSTLVSNDEFVFHAFEINY